MVMATNLLETANGLHEGFISTNENSAVPVENDGVGLAEDEKLSSCCCLPSRVCRKKPSVEESSHTVDFCLDTSLHGLKYLGQPQRHCFERFFWFATFVIGCVVAAILIADIWMKYFTNPIVITFQPFEMPIEQIPFPAITICNTNKILRSKAEQFIEAQIQGAENIDRHHIENEEDELPDYYLDQICSSSRKFSEKFTNPLLNIAHTPIIEDVTISELQAIMTHSNISDYESLHKLFAQFLSKNTQTCEDMILQCVWRDEVQNCSKLFKRNGVSEFGTCCTFNMVPEVLLRTYKTSDVEENEEDLVNWPKKDLEIDDLLMKGRKKTKWPKRQYRAGRSSGLSILINPSLSEYFCTDSDSEGFLLQTHLPIDAPDVQDFGIAIKPNSESFISIKPEITMADPEIKSYKLDKRECYFDGEFELAYYNYYTVSNCLDECAANKTYLSCGCVLFYMPRDNKRHICDPTKVPCAEKLRKKFLKYGINKLCLDCLPTCTELEYLDELTSSPLQMSDNYNTSDFGTRSNLSIVHIYIGQDSTYPRYRTKLFGLTDLIANTGGLMGLCLGFSGLSLIECLYFFTLRAWCRPREGRSIWSIISRKNKISSQSDN